MMADRKRGPMRPLVGGSRVESWTDAASRNLANRISRRSMISRLGKTAMALTLGSAGVSLLADPASAHFSPTCGSCSGSCCSSNSVLCANLPGHNANSCPSGSCECGYWTVSQPGCPGTGLRKWTDCCLGGDPCTCPGGTPSNCRHKTYSQGCTDCWHHIRCRKYVCL